MGVFASMFNRLLSRKEEISILMIGLDAAGKTSILHKLKIGGAFVTTCPTIGLNVEKIEFKNLSFTIMDIGGHEKIRPLWKHYFKGVRGVIFVVDSNDADRISEARYELQVLLSEDELKDAAVLIFANKQVSTPTPTRLAGQAAPDTRPPPAFRFRTRFLLTRTPRRTSPDPSPPKASRRGWSFLPPAHAHGTCSRRARARARASARASTGSRCSSPAPCPRPRAPTPPPAR